MTPFLLWVNAVILGFTAIPVVSGGVAWVSGRDAWTVPKPLELKLYAIAVLLGVAWIAVSARFLSHFPSRPSILYRWSLVAMLPCVAIADALTPLALPQYLGMSSAALCALLICVYEIQDAPGRYGAAARAWSAAALCCSIVVTLLLVATFSTGNVFTPFSIRGAVVFGITWLLVQDRVKGIPDVSWSFLGFGITFIAVFLSSHNHYDVLHYSFILGPVTENLHGGKHPLANTDAQYGGGLTLFLSLYFRVVWGIVTNQGLTILLKVLTFGQFLLLYAIGARLYRSRRIACCALVAILVFGYFSQATNYFMYPSIGALRFGILYLIVGVSLCEWFRPETRLALNAALAAIGTIWSVESFVYVVPAFLAGEWLAGNGMKAARAYVMALAAALVAYLLLPWLRGVPIDLRRYYEYALMYQQGFGQMALERATSMWMLFPLLYVWIIAEISYRRIADKHVLMLAVYGLAIFTYFGGRAHPNNLHHIAIPFILLAVYEAARLPIRWRSAALAGFMTVLLTAHYSHFRSGVILRDVWSVSAAGLGLWHPSVLRAARGGGCSPDMRRLLGYTHDDRIAIITTRLDLHTLLSCLRVSNALDLDPLIETAIHPVAADRAVKGARMLSQRYPIIVYGQETLDDPLTTRLLAAAGAQEMERFTLGDTMVIRFWKTVPGATGP